MEAGDTNSNTNGYNTHSVDEGDALGNTKFPQSNVIAPMSSERNAKYYKMDHPNRGLALIFNHELFKIAGLKPRTGTQVDCKNLRRQLERLHFKVVVYDDLEHQDVLGKVREAASIDYTQYDCFVMAVLSHGDKGILYAKDNGYKPEMLWCAFTGDLVPTLAGKPKLFFIQACQGDQLDRGVTLSRTETDGAPHSYKIPTHADFLIAYSTVAGFFSWRNTTRGSWFVQALCDELEANGFNEDLLTMLTFVCQRVALDYESNTPDVPHMHAQKQIPCITSMLTRLVKFTKRQ